MAFLSNKTVNRLNLHLALVTLLEQAFSVFGPIYLYNRGFSVAEILTGMALVIFLRMPMRLLSLPIISRFGLKTALMIGATGYALTFPVLSEVSGVDCWLLLYAILYSIFNAMHWWAFHTFYSLAGELEKRGRQVATGYALATGIAALAPVLCAVMIAHEGFRDYFILAFPLIAAMLANLAFAKNIPIAPVRWREGREAVGSLGAKIHLMDSSSSYPMGICWLFVVYFYVGKMEPLGGIITFGIAVQAVYQLLLGTWMDKGRGTRITHAAGCLQSLTVLGRAFFPLSLAGILGLGALGAAGNVHYLASETTALYNDAKGSPHPLWYWLFTEMGWDVGSLFGAGGAALLLWLGVDLRHVILLALPSLLALWWLLHRYYAKHRYVIPAT